MQMVLWEECWSASGTTLGHLDMEGVEWGGGVGVMWWDRGFVRKGRTSEQFHEQFLFQIALDVVHFILSKTPTWHVPIYLHCSAAGISQRCRFQVDEVKLGVPYYTGVSLFLGAHPVTLPLIQIGGAPASCLPEWNTLPSDRHPRPWCEKGAGDGDAMLVFVRGPMNLWQLQFLHLAGHLPER